VILEQAPEPVRRTLDCGRTISGRLSSWRTIRRPLSASSVSTPGAWRSTSCPTIVGSRLPAEYASAGFATPAVAASDLADDETLLLLDYVEGEPAERWNIGTYALAAGALGRAQAPFLAGRPLPHVPWLSHGFLRDYSSTKPVDWSLFDDHRAWAHPMVNRNVPSELRDASRWLHSVSDSLYDIAERLPRTLCHLDFWTKNLIGGDDGTIVLLDWAFVGDGSIGEDIGNLVPDAVFDHFVPAASLPDLQAAVLASYCAGLNEGGWRGDRRLAELGFCVSAVKYDWLTPHMLASTAADRQLRYGGTELIDADYRFRERGQALLHNVRNAQRALALAAEVRWPA
jgi:hypothetical protein